MSMHKSTAKKGAGKNPFEDLAYNYKVNVFDLLDPEERKRMNNLINGPNTVVKEDDITIHTVERSKNLDSLIAVVFYREFKVEKKKSEQAKKTPREMLEGDSED